MALPDEPITEAPQVSNSSSGKRLPPARVTKRFQEPLLQVREAAKLAGVSRSEFKKRLCDGIYPSVVDEVTGWRWIPKFKLLEVLANGVNLAKNGSNGSANGSSEEARRLSRERFDEKNPSHSAPRKAGGHPKMVGTGSTLFTGETAQVVFALLREGKSVSDIVIERGIHPDVVRATAASYFEINDELRLSTNERKEIEEAMLLKPGHLKSGAVLLAAIKKNAAARITCTQCFSNAASYCEECVTKTLHEVTVRAEKKAQNETGPDPKI